MITLQPVESIGRAKTMTPKGVAVHPRLHIASSGTPIRGRIPPGGHTRAASGGEARRGDQATCTQCKQLRTAAPQSSARRPAAAEEEESNGAARSTYGARAPVAEAAERAAAGPCRCRRSRGRRVRAEAGGEAAGDARAPRWPGAVAFAKLTFFCFQQLKGQAVRTPGGAANRVDIKP